MILSSYKKNNIFWKLVAIIWRSVHQYLLRNNRKQNHAESKGGGGSLYIALHALHAYMNPGLSSKKKQDYDCSSGGSHWKGSQALCMIPESVFRKGPFPLENLYPPVPLYSRRGLAEFCPRTLRIWLLQGEAGGEKNGTGIPLSFCICLIKWKLYSWKLNQSNH